MARRRDFALGGVSRKPERQRADRAQAERKRKRMVERVTEAFEQRAPLSERSNRTWLKAHSSGRAPFRDR
jgi:hypothetical protein